MTVTSNRPCEILKSRCGICPHEMIKKQELWCALAEKWKAQNFIPSYSFDLVSVTIANLPTFPVLRCSRLRPRPSEHHLAMRRQGIATSRPRLNFESVSHRQGGFLIGLQRYFLRKHNVPCN
ncbi:hypothetical protein ABIF72_003981 [Bradyrhizobium japonicum]